MVPLSISDRRLHQATTFIAAGTLILGLLLMVAPRDWALRLTREGHLIETLSEWVAAGGILFAAVNLGRFRSWIWFSILLLLVWLYLRELDYQKLFTPRSIESVGFYSSPDIAPSMKLLALLAYSPFAAAGLHLAWAGFREMRATHLPRAAWWRPLGLAGGFLVVALVGEKLMPRWWQILEEVFELGFAVLVVLVVASVTFRPRGSPARPHRECELGNRPQS